MIKIKGLNWEKGSGDHFVFGYIRDGTGRGKRIQYFYYLYVSFGNGWGNGCWFGDLTSGDGESWGSRSFKEEFQKYD